MSAFSFLGFLVTLVLAPILNGWALSILWKWFMVPTLGLPVLSVAQTIGVALVIGQFTYRPIPTTSKKKETATEEIRAALLKAIAFTYIAPFVALLIGWIVQRFM